ncbi:unnamed protein product [Calypogeia fissa]
MATRRKSIASFLGTFGIVLLLFAVQMMGTEAVFGSWFRNGRQERMEKTTTEREASGPDSRTTTTTTIQRYQFDLETPELLSGARGKQLYEKSNALSQENSCWQEAYTGLLSNCRDILKDETQKSRLALRLTNCFLKTSGRQQLKKCPESWPVASCVKELDDHNHAVFLAFYIDSAAMCHFLQSQEFKKETEQLVNDLKYSAQYTENKLDSIGHQLDDQHAAILERSGNILDIQKKLQLEHALLQESIQSGMGDLQEAADEAQQQLNLVNQYQKAIADKQRELAESLREEFSDLQRKSNQLGSSMTNLHGSVDDLTEKSMHGQEEAMRGLSEIQRIQLEGIKESRLSVDSLVEEARRHQDEFRTWQNELDDMHNRLVDGTTTMIQAQENFVTKQAAIFTTMEKLFSLHNSILLESRAVKTLTLYFALSIFVYMATTTKQTRNARILLYFGLFLTLTFEIWLIRFKMEKLSAQTTRLTWPPKQIVWLRYGYGVVALTYLLYTYLAHKDYEYLSYRMLKDIHGRFGDQSRLQEKLLGEYLSRCEICKDLPQPNGQPSGQHSGLHSLPLEDKRPSLPYVDCESEFKEEKAESTTKRKARSATSRPKGLRQPKEPATVSSPPPRTRRRAAAGSTHTSGY